MPGADTPTCLERSQDACEAGGTASWVPAAQEAATAAMTEAMLTCYGRELSQEQVALLASRDAAAS